MPEAFSTEAIGAVFAAVLAFLTRLLVLAIRFARSPEGRVILRVMREAGVKAALKARAAFAAGLAGARSAESEGGIVVTPHERKLLARDTAQTFVRELDVLGVLSKVAEAFGGVEALEDELTRRIEGKLKT